jgi:uncharacterized protein YjbI with pentapeptide repeats
MVDLALADTGATMRLVTLLFPFLCAHPALSADMTAREITAYLFRSPAGTKPDLSHKDLSGLDLSDLDFKKATLDGANLFGSDLSRANLSGTSLRGARLDRATLIDADFTEADLTGASILRPNIFADMEAFRPSNHLSFAKTRMANAHLNGTFDGVNFTGADLTAALFGPRDPREEVLITPMMSLIGATFNNAILVQVDFSGNDLRDARFIGADLSRANVRDTRLDGADFTDATLSAADFTGATLRDTNFKKAKALERAIGLITQPRP